MVTESLIANDILSEIKSKEEQVKELEAILAKTKFELQELKRINAGNVTIGWKESIKWCLSVDIDNSYFFVKTPAFVAKCIASKHGVEVTRDIKNKISTTLSIMHNQSLIGRVQHNGKSFYGMPELFKKDLVTLRPENIKIVDELNKYQ